MDPLEYQQVLSVLDKGEIAHWDPVMNGGKPLWDALASDMLPGKTKLSDIQKINAITTLIRLRLWGDEKTLHHILIGAMETSHPEVREKAARTMAGLVRLSREESHENERLDPTVLIEPLRKALIEGVSGNTARLIREAIQ